MSNVFVKKYPIERVAEVHADLVQAGIKHRFIWSGPRYVYSPLKGRWAKAAREVGASCNHTRSYTLKANATHGRLYFIY